MDLDPRIGRLPVLLLGVLADTVALVDLGSNAAAVFFVPGGLFEIVLPLQLFAFGFSRARAPDRSGKGDE